MSEEVKATTGRIDVMLGPVLFVDSLSIATREDQVHYVELSAQVPVGAHGQVRFMVTKGALEGWIDLLCKHTGHYPTAPRGQKKLDKKQIVLD
jgi:hypothetical protein